MLLRAPTMLFDMSKIDSNIKDDNDDHIEVDL